MRTLATVSFLLAALSVATADDTGDREKGRQVYFDHACYACHGYNGIGRRNIANRASGILVNEQVFIRYLRARGEQNPRFPAQTMPHYPASSLPDEDARHLYAYVSSLVDEPPAIEEAPALKAIVDAAEAKQ